MPQEAPSPLDPYPPLNVLKALDEDLWIVDGPVVWMRYLGFHLPFSTRMTIVRLSGGGLWVHSPTQLTRSLRQEVAALGPVACLVAPNRLHWVSLKDWQAAFPDALTFAAPGVEKNAARSGFRIDAILKDGPPKAWAGAIDQVLVPGSVLTEAVFFHRATATLIVTDLIENFEPGHVHGRWLTFLMRLGGVLHPGGTPRDLRLTFLGRGPAMRKAAQTMLGWAPARIILVHGRCYEENAAEELARIFKWMG